MTKFKKLLDLKIHTIKYVAQNVFRSVDMIAKYAAGRSEPTAKTSQAIADLFGVSHRWLWCDERTDIDDFEEEKTYVREDENERSFKRQKV